MESHAGSLSGADLATADVLQQRQTHPAMVRTVTGIAAPAAGEFLPFPGRKQRNQGLRFGADALHPLSAR